MIDLSNPRLLSLVASLRQGSHAGPFADWMEERGGLLQAVGEACLLYAKPPIWSERAIGSDAEMVPMKAFVSQAEDDSLRPLLCELSRQLYGERVGEKMTDWRIERRASGVYCLKNEWDGSCVACHLPPDEARISLKQHVLRELDNVVPELRVPVRISSPTFNYREDSMYGDNYSLDIKEHTLESIRDGLTGITYTLSPTIANDRLFEHVAGDGFVTAWVKASEMIKEFVTRSIGVRSNKGPTEPR